MPESWCVWYIESVVSAYPDGSRAWFMYEGKHVRHQWFISVVKMSLRAKQYYVLLKTRYTQLRHCIVRSAVHQQGDFSFKLIYTKW